MQSINEVDIEIPEGIEVLDSEDCVSNVCWFMCGFAAGEVESRIWKGDKQLENGEEKYVIDGYTREKNRFKYLVEIINDIREQKVIRGKCGLFRDLESATLYAATQIQKL